MPSVYQPRRPRASPLWQLVHHGWDDFLADYETCHRKTHGPLRRNTRAVVQNFYRCGDLSRGFTMPRPLRGIFRKRRHLLDLLFRTAVECLRDWFRARLDLPDGQLAAIASVQTFGDYLVFHPHLHVLAATGLYDREGRFHLLPVESAEPLAELFRHRFIEVLLREKLISERKSRQLLNWKHSGFNLDAGNKPVAADNVAGRQALAEYLLRAPFSLDKITWVEKTRRVIYRSSRSWRTKRNFQVFTATGFLAAAVEHIPPKNRHTIRYYGRYSNKCRGMEVEAWEGNVDRDPSDVVPPAPAESARALRPLWRNLIIRIWGADPLICPCCKGLMKVRGSLTRPEEIEKRRRPVGVLDRNPRSG